MKSLELVANGAFSLVDKVAPHIKADQCLIRVSVCGVCSTDIYRSHDNGAYFYPLVMGHEIAGKIEAVGDEISEFTPGDAVGVFPLIPCFGCAECDAGNFMLCHDYSYHGSRCEGGYSELLAVNAWNLIKIPEGVDIKDAAFLEPTSVLVHAMRKSGLWESSRRRVLIIGAGFLGLILAQILASRDAGHEIWVTDKNAFKLDLLPPGVRKVTSLDDIKGQMFETIFEGTGSANGVGVAIDHVGRGGTICLLGNPSSDVRIEQNAFSQLLRKEVRIQGSWNSAFRHDPDDDWSHVLNLMQQGLKPSQYVSHEFGLEGVPDFLKNCWGHKSGAGGFSHIKGLALP